jgi:L-rhamnose mutarotase
MERLCNTLRIAPGREDEYDRRHVEIWPEMVEAIKDAGVSNVTLFRRGSDVIVVYECHPDVETCFARLAEHGVGERWQASMEELVTDRTDGVGELIRYQEIWHLD